MGCNAKQVQNTINLIRAGNLDFEQLCSFADDSSPLIKYNALDILALSFADNNLALDILTEQANRPENASFKFGGIPLSFLIVQFISRIGSEKSNLVVCTLIDKMSVKERELFRCISKQNAN